MGGYHRTLMHVCAITLLKIAATRMLVSDSDSEDSDDDDDLLLDLSSSDSDNDSDEDVEELFLARAAIARSKSNPTGVRIFHNRTHIVFAP